MPDCPIMLTSNGMCKESQLLVKVYEVPPTVMAQHPSTPTMGCSSLKCSQPLQDHTLVERLVALIARHVGPAHRGCVNAPRHYASSGAKRSYAPPPHAQAHAVTITRGRDRVSPAPPKRLRFASPPPRPPVAISSALALDLFPLLKLVQETSYLARDNHQPHSRMLDGLSFLLFPRRSYPARQGLRSAYIVYPRAGTQGSVHDAPRKPRAGHRRGQPARSVCKRAPQHPP
ncbi:hypothetical protein BKA62DRAFT_273244 [Auriculariales sp. MPI-PUGE-AT-0066]|nr:hypothetical protein BKA62DRAFT_273244 [Auriculariales sp. MPI-PUGE-AT-0066]